MDVEDHISYAFIVLDSQIGMKERKTTNKRLIGRFGIMTACASFLDQTRAMVFI